MSPGATQIVLSEKEQEALVQITNRHRSEQQQALRARLILAAAQGTSNAQIARELQSMWIRCVCGEIAGRIAGDRSGHAQCRRALASAPRPGTPPKFSAEQRCQMAALACEAPL